MVPGRDFVHMVFAHGQACQTGMPDLEHIRAICHANELCRRRSLERGIGKSACAVAWVAPRVRQLGQRSPRVFGIAAMDFSSESGVGRKFAFWDSGETEFSRSPEWVPDAETWGCHPHRQFSPFILGLGRIIDGVVSIG